MLCRRLGSSDMLLPWSSSSSNSWSKPRGSEYDDPLVGVLDVDSDCLISVSLEAIEVAANRRLSTKYSECLADSRGSAKVDDCGDWPSVGVTLAGASLDSGGAAEEGV